ncbi:MAG: VWA domain-containing protein, partial [Polaribacter sp.]
MQTTTILYIISALLGSLSIAFFQYFFKRKQKHTIDILLFVLRTFSLFLLGLLLINPTIKKQEIENIKPILSVLIDNSQSTKYFKEEHTVGKIIEKVKKNKQLNKKFEINFFSFGETTNVLDSLSFDENKTNIFDGINAINNLYKDHLGVTLLISDGNQTIGNDYEFINSKQAIFPLVIGDTTQFKDVRISQLNVNKYSYIKNKFPVETLLFYEGKENVRTRFSIYHKGKTVFTQRVTFSPTEKSKTILANLQANKEGQNYFTASVSKLANEKNIKNNIKNFSVEVINEQTKVLLLASTLHPDLGALKKAIESNKQRSVDIQLIQKSKNQINDYQLIILYQPTNKFDTIITELQKQNSNFLLISGANTDWSFINTKQLGFTKKAINQTENYGADFNDRFLTFLQKDIGFNQFPPLKDKFGEVIITKSYQAILNQNINGIASKQPLLATFEENNQKSAVLFGEGIWKWRAASFLQNNSFQDFDDFIGNLVQYLASNKKRNRLDIKSESLYAANETINIAAFYTDKNYTFDNRASLKIAIT